MDRRSYLSSVASLPLVPLFSKLTTNRNLIETRKMCPPARNHDEFESRDYWYTLTNDGTSRRTSNEDEVDRVVYVAVRKGSSVDATKMIPPDEFDHLEYDLYTNLLTEENRILVAQRGLVKPSVVD